jgi:hypothetical protein
MPAGIKTPDRTGADTESESRGVVQGVRLDVPVVRSNKRTYVPCGDILSLDFRGHGVVRAVLQPCVFPRTSGVARGINQDKALAGGCQPASTPFCLTVTASG